ncbi:MAG: D-aminoacylase [Candidatus Aminicenantes bacterium]
MKLGKQSLIFNHQVIAAAVFFITFLLLSGIQAYTQSYDIIIENGRIIDGTGCPWYRADIAVRDGRIAFIGNLKKASAERRIDASGKFVVPGFIDIHTHSDRSITTEPWGPLAENSVRQGITTIVAGNCGGSEFPVKEHLAEVQRLRPSINYTVLVGHNTIRRLVMGMEDRAPAPEELSRMKILVAHGMESGAVGFSTGLYYTPGFYADTEEIIELAKAAAEYGGIYASHIRDESDYNIGLAAAVKEAVAVGESAGIPVQISHIKCLGTPVWKKSDDVLKIIHEARLRGVDVTADQYAYRASGTSISGALIPPWAVSGPGTSRENFLETLRDPAGLEKLRKDVASNITRRGGADTLLLRSSPPDTEFAGMYLNEAAEAMCLNPVEAAIALQKKGGAGLASFNMSEYDMEHFMKSPYVMIGSDGGIAEYGREMPHPRSYGNFPRVLSVFVRDKGLLTWEEAIKKMTSMPAGRLGLFDRGIIKEGMAADMVVFSPETVEDTADFLNPHQYPEGIPYVLVNGKLVVDEAKHTGVRSGRVL